MKWWRDKKPKVAIQSSKCSLQISRLPDLQTSIQHPSSVWSPKPWGAKLLAHHCRLKNRSHCGWRLQSFCSHMPTCLACKKGNPWFFFKKKWCIRNMRLKGSDDDDDDDDDDDNNNQQQQQQQQQHAAASMTSWWVNSCLANGESPTYGYILRCTNSRLKYLFSVSNEPFCSDWCFWPWLFLTPLKQLAWLTFHFCCSLPVSTPKTMKKKSSLLRTIGQEGLGWLKPPTIHHEPLTK